MMKKETYEELLHSISNFVEKDNICTDELSRLAWGTDAGFYRLIPEVVFFPQDDWEVSNIMQFADLLHVPVTFRAAGTSLSGQAISDSVLIVAGKGWENYTISPDAETITLQPGITGQRVNELLKPYGRKFSPDPASINSAMVGGIVVNNASGMNCGVHANSDRMLLSAYILLIHGERVDTGDRDSRDRFARQRPDFLRKIEAIRDRVRQDTALAERIRHKYSIKNVTGLNLLPFLLYDDPFDIMAHLIVGSEGTLAFLAEATFRTELDYPCKASAMLYFADIQEACKAVVVMKKLLDENGETTVKGAELLDWKSLKSVGDTTGEGLTAVLTETKALSPEALTRNIQQITTALRDFRTCIPVYFTDKESEYSRYWAIRSGIFPSVGGTRPPGTTTLIEDVAFHIENLPEATAALQQLLVKHGYDDACIYGHALEGNYHFIINQSFHLPEEVARYKALMDDVIHLVVDVYDGSLKAEHGTGRNMAPFVKYEWGDSAYEVMREVKQLFDPKGLLNPGVIFNDDPQCHIRNFKPLPLLHPDVDKCIECGFCEINCLTCGFTLSSRQRIVVQREIARLKASGEDAKRLQLLQKQYRYPGNRTCAGDGLCAMSCPMNINTGRLTHAIRRSERPAGSAGYVVGRFAAAHLSLVRKGIRPILTLARCAHTVLGVRAMSRLTKLLHKLPYFPLWTPAMPGNYRFRASSSAVHSPLKVVYFPSCINQTMGLPKDSPEKQPLVSALMSLLQKAGYEVIFPREMSRLCCGTIWESKGMPDIADRKAAELGAALYEASEQGRYPVVCDQSPCLYRMRQTIKQVRLYEPVEFISTFLLDKLAFVPTDEAVAVHITCSMRKMGLEESLIALAKHCSSKVLIPEEVGCCGFAGDKGFTCPEVNAYALRKLRPQIEKACVKTGYSNSRTCEIGLSTHSGVAYQSIVYLVDQCTK